MSSPFGSQGGDLVKQPDEDAKAGLLLLAVCIKVGQPTPMTRRLFWDSLVSYEGDRFLELRLQAVSDLSSNGNHIEGLEDGVSKYLCQLLKAAFRKAGQARKRDQIHEGRIDSLEELTLHRAFHLIDQLLKSSSPFLEESDFSIIMDQLVHVCKKTTSTVDIKNATDVMGTLACHAPVSPRSFRPCLNVICNIYKLLDAVQPHIWSVLRTIFNSNLRSDVMDGLYHILQAPAGKQITAEIQGALCILRDLALNDGKDNMPKTTLSILGPAVGVVIRQTKEPGVASDTLELYRMTVENPLLWVRLFEEADWTGFRESIEKAAALLVQSVPRNGPSDEAKVGKDAERGVRALDVITIGICKEFNNLHVLQQEEAVKLFFKLGTMLSDDAVTTLLSYLSTRPYLASPANANHREIWSQLFPAFCQQSGTTARYPVSNPGASGKHV